MEINFVSIATNLYINYWRDLVDSLNSEFEILDDVRIHIFTDDIETANEVAMAHPNLEIKIVQIPNLGWPEATLARYRYVAEVAKESHGVVAYIDADMLILRDIQGTLASESIHNKMVLVHHPGYWRPRGFMRIKLYSKHFRIFIRDCYLLFLMGGIGSWETRRISAAHVPRFRRDAYYCGGFWFGLTEQVLSFCNEQADSVRLDSEKGVTAKWHDESHLNKWASMNDFRALTPAFCFSENTPNISSLDPHVMAVDKWELTR